MSENRDQGKGLKISDTGSGAQPASSSATSSASSETAARPASSPETAAGSPKSAGGDPTAAVTKGVGDNATSATGAAKSPNDDHDDIKKGLATDAPPRTEAEQKIDERVEKETREQEKVRAQLEENEKRRRVTDFEQSEGSLHTRALDHSLGLVEHLGCPGRYMGKAPQREEQEYSPCPTCRMPLTGGNSKFTPLPYILPEAGLLVKGEDGTFSALPSDGTLTNATAETWLSLKNPTTGKPLVPESTKEGTEDRRKAAGLSEE